MRSSRRKLADANRVLSRKTKPSLLRSVLFLLGRLKEEAFEGELESIVLIAQEKLGDAILLTPLIGGLRRALPDLEIHVVTFSSVYDFFRNDRNVDAVYRGKNHYWSYYRAMHRRRFDVLFNPKDHASFTGLYQSRMLPARHRVGISHPFHDGFFHHTLRFDYHRHVVEKNMALLDYLGLPYGEEDCRPYLPEGPVSPEVAEFVPGGGGRLLGINLSAGSPGREWPLEKWKAFLDGVRMPAMVFSMPERLPDKRDLERTFDRVIATPPTHSIYDVGRLIRHLDCLVTPDTSLVHLASCHAIPVVGLYGSDPEQYERFYPYRVPHRMLTSPRERVADIPVSDVVEAADSLMDEGK